MKLVALVLMLVTGCAVSVAPAAPRQTTYRVVIQSAFSQSRIADIEAGIDMWRVSVTQLELDVSVSDTCEGEAICVAYRPGIANVLGVTGRHGATTLVELYSDNQKWDDAGLTNTAAHEMGHAFGLHHTAAGTLMAPAQVDEPDHVTEADVAQFWSFR